MKDYGIVTSNVTGTYPNVLPKNSSTGTSTDGTPYVADLIQPMWALTQALMSRCGLTNSGTIEAYTAVGSGDLNGLGYVSGSPAQQIMWAMQRHFGMPGEIIEHFLNSTAQGQSRSLLLTGQMVDGFLYPDLWFNTWVGAGTNGTAPAFYTTSDAGGTTRATTGLTVNGVTGGRYIKMPDMRGYALRGWDPANSRDPAGSTRGLGSAQLDAMQGHKHSSTSPIGASLTAGASGFNAGSLGDSGIPTTDGTNGTSRTAIETRMVNIQCYFAIRV